ncbi:hypothetical protein [Leptonema illini]|uniref:Uncharacterized protein n=2 Tax=Leptonema illini TaxID=183 RepID=H2CA53_9LEPT|nr:hypothetical protein [Leptonema illini]EHQ06211.1 hypothetical protein Lepil_1523 [Leptonema illini DSM 21528]
MNNLTSESRTLNIRYALPTEILDRLSAVYECMDGWLGYGNGENGEEGIPYWFSFKESGPSISASMEPSGLQFDVSHMNKEEWNSWLSRFKAEATKTLGFKVGELEIGEVDEEIEWIDEA